MANEFLKANLPSPVHVCGYCIGADSRLLVAGICEYLCLNTVTEVHEGAILYGSLNCT